MDRFQASVGAVDISPPHALPTAGFGRTEPASGIKEPLEINAMLLRQGDTAVALISIDVLFVGEELRKAAELALKPLPPECILFGASHTHFAPATERLLPSLGPIDESYLEDVKAKLTALLHQLQTEVPVDAELRHSSAEASHSVNRRKKCRFWPRKRPFPHLRFNYYALAPNEAGVRDETVHVVGVYPLDETGPSAEPLSVLWSYTCHPVSQPYLDSVSADYPGVVRNHLRQAYADEMPCLFLQGFTGDIRPNVIGDTSSPRAKLTELLFGTKPFGTFTPEGWEDWSSSLARCVKGALRPNAGEKAGVSLSGKLSASSFELPVASLQDQEVDRPDAHFQRVSIGDELDIVAVSAEAVLDIRKLIPDRPGRVMAVGYTDHCFGYLPTSEIHRQGGYEAGEFRQAFSLPGEFIPELDAVVGQGFQKLFETRAET